MKSQARSYIVPIWRRWRWWSLGAVVALGLGMRAWQLASLPPGLSGGEAGIGLSALRLVESGQVPGFTPETSYAPLWSMLQALPMAAFGHTALALRLWPVVIGVAAIVLVWLWAKDWFGERVAWVAALLMAVTPWAVTLSRSASPAVLALVLVPLGLFAAGRAYTRGGKWWWLASAVYGVSLGCGPLGWTTSLVLGLLGAVALYYRRRALVGRTQIIIAVASGLAGLGAAIWAALTPGWVNGFVAASQATLSLPTLLATAAKVAAMFNLRGDPSFLHNFYSEPMLNAFVGLVFIAGLLISLTRLRRRPYQALLIVFVAGLVPAIVTPLASPNAAHAAVALPGVLVLAGIGVSYLLELWYGTFPINSAARSLGLAAILALLSLSVFQGYVQIYRAWAGSAETYAAYNEAAVQAAASLPKGAGSPATFVVASPAEQPVVAYLAHGTTYQAVSPASIAGLSSGTPKRFVITAAVRNQAATSLATSFPGGTLKPHYSGFSQNELFYTYESSR